MENNSYDFSGWATRANIKCADGRTICKDAFKDNDGEVVPLVWNHCHNDPLNVLGHALLENRDEGVYAYCTFNDTDAGRSAKELVQHQDVSALSIYANRLKQEGGNVLHGAIREVSLVLAGANPGAYIDSIIAHGEESEEEAVIYSGEDIVLMHSENKEGEKKEMAEDTKKNENSNSEKEETVEDVINALTDKQKKVVYALIGEALSQNGKKENVEEGDESMKHNVFDNDEQDVQDEKGQVLSHSDMEEIIADAKRYGSLKESAIAHGVENVVCHADGDVVTGTGTSTYGIKDIDWLFPEATNVNRTPGFIKRDTGWVAKVMNGVHHVPFSRIKSQFANITEDDARAKGYIKGKLKKEEVFGLLKRATTPTTIYKKQKLDRDDVIDITDFDVVSWLKSEMRVMLDEELARAFLIGDGRAASSDDKINESNIRPIAKDASLFTIQYDIDLSATGVNKYKEFIAGAVRSRKGYKGSGSPTLFTTEDMVIECLLLEDAQGRRLYNNVNELASAMHVKEIVTVPVMEGVKAANDEELMGVIVNLADYSVGADKGGAVNLFDDFDIDYNAMKYLIETRCSGALVVPYSAIVLRKKAA